MFEVIDVMLRLHRRRPRRRPLPMQRCSFPRAEPLQLFEYLASSPFPLIVTRFCPLSRHIRLDQSTSNVRAKA